MGKVVVHIGAKGLERIQLAAENRREERESWRLYQSIRSALDVLESRFKQTGQEPAGKADGRRV